MNIRYTLGAFRQLGEILAHITERSESGALHVEMSIQMTIVSLAYFPELGKKTSTTNIQQVVVPRYPYKIFYRIRNDEVIIVRIRHTRQNS